MNATATQPDPAHKLPAANVGSSVALRSMKVAQMPFTSIGALLVTLAVLPATAQGLVASTTPANADHGASEPPLSDERKASVLAALRDVWRSKTIDRRQYDQSIAWVNASPCRGIDRSLAPQAQRQLESAIASEQHLAKVAVFAVFRSGGWTIAYTDASDGDEPYLFYSGSPERGAHPVTAWSGAAAVFETSDIARQVKKDVPGIPPKLADCFAWHVTLHLE